MLVWKATTRMILLATHREARNTVLMKSPTRLQPVTAIPAAAEADFLEKVGRRVRELREERGLTRRSLANQADVSGRYLGQLETGEGNVSIMLLRRLALVLNVPISELLEIEPEQLEQQSVRRFLQQIPRHRMPDLLSRLEREVGSEQEGRRRQIYFGPATIARTRRAVPRDGSRDRGRVRTAAIGAIFAVRPSGVSAIRRPLPESHHQGVPAGSSIGRRRCRIRGKHL